jgi:hypothetical protein
MTPPWDWGGDGGGIFLLALGIAFAIIGIAAWWYERKLDD